MGMRTIGGDCAFRSGDGYEQQDLVGDERSESDQGCQRNLKDPAVAAHLPNHRHDSDHRQQFEGRSQRRIDLKQPGHDRIDFDGQSRAIAGSGATVEEKD